MNEAIERLPVSVQVQVPEKVVLKKIPGKWLDVRYQSNFWPPCMAPVHTRELIGDDHDHCLVKANMNWTNKQYIMLQ